MQEIIIGTAGIPSGAKGILEGIAYNSKIGLQALEIEFVHGINMGTELAKKAGQTAMQNNISLSVHAPYYINLCNPDKVADSQKRILDSCLLAKELNAKIVVFHPGFYQKLSRSDALSMVLESCQEMEKILSSSNNSVLLGLETTGKKSQFGELQEIIEICKKCKVCVPVTDFSHIYARNSGKIDYHEIFSSLKELKLSHLHSHFSGIEYAESGEKRHLPLGKNPDLKEFVSQVLKSKASITIINESPLLEQDCLKLKQEFEKNGHKFMV